MFFSITELVKAALEGFISVCSQVQLELSFHQSLPTTYYRILCNFKPGKKDLVGAGLSYYACDKEEARILTRELSFQWVVPPMPTCVSATEEPLFLSRGAAGPSTPLTFMSPSVRIGITCHADLQVTKPGFNKQDGP